jgi:hypothetical protein
LLASILHIDQKPAAAIFLSIYNSRIQQQVLRAAAEAVLITDDFEIFSAFMNVVATIEKERNDVVHGVFGGSPFVAGLMWAEQKHFVGHTFTVWSSGFANMNASEFLSKTFVYTAEDLETTASHIEWLHRCVGTMSTYFTSTNEERRDQLRRQLCAEPLIAQELSRIRADQKTTPPPRSPQDRKGKKRGR